MAEARKLRRDRAITWGAAAVLLAGCAHAPLGPGAQKPQEIQFEPVTVTGDPELAKLNDEELFAGGSSASAAGEYAQAARYFGRLADFFPQSAHRAQALLQAGLADEKLDRWEEANARFSELADAGRGQGEALDAAFRQAEALYHLERFDAAVQLLSALSARADLPPARHLEAVIQRGVCELEAGRKEEAEATLRQALDERDKLADPGEVDPYLVGQADFFLGEIYRLHFEGVAFAPDRDVDQLAKDMEYKAELLLSAQGHYLRAIRSGNGHWATASGARIGALYESFYDQVLHAPPPRELDPAAAGVYREELRKKIRVLLSKAIAIYEETLEAAQRLGAQTPFVEETRERLKRIKDLLVADSEADDAPPPAPSAPVPKT